MMIRFIVLNDIHVADTPPLGRFGDYREQILNKLRGVKEYCDANNVDNVILTGDVFHQKRPDRTSHRLVQELIKILRDFPPWHGPCWVVPGNHDLSEAGIDSIQRQPLGVLAKAHAVELFMTGDYKAIEKDGLRVGFVARHYDVHRELDPEYYSLSDHEKKMLSHCQMKVMVVHGALVPDGVSPNFPVLQMHQLDLEGEIDLVLAGHIHDSFGIVETNEDIIFCNLGSLSRVSRTKEHLDPNNVRCMLQVTIDNGEMELEAIPIPNMLPPSEVFLDKISEDGDDDHDFSEFAESLATSILFEDQSLEALLANVEAPDTIKRRLRYYLEGSL